MEWESRFTLGLNAEKKYQLYRKMIQIKIVHIKFPTKKISECLFLSLSVMKQLEKILMEV